MEEEREKMRAAQQVALERAQMAAKRYCCLCHTHLLCCPSWNTSTYNVHRRFGGSGFAPAFKPIGQANAQTGLGEWTTVGSSFTVATPAPAKPMTTGVKRSKESEESQAKIAEKKARLAKFGLKFQSAGTLVTIGEQLGRDSSIYRTPAVIQRLGGSDGNDTREVDSSSSQSSTSSKSKTSKLDKGSKESSSGSEKKLSFGFQKSQSKLKQQPQLSGGKGNHDDVGVAQPKGVYTSTWEKPGGSREKIEPAQKDEEERKGPPPKLMSRQRELTLERAFGAESDDEDDSLATLQQLTVRSQPKFRFNIRK